MSKDRDQRMAPFPFSSALPDLQRALSNGALLSLLLGGVRLARSCIALPPLFCGSGGRFLRTVPDEGGFALS
jgi:hypothetical protein